MNKNLLLFYNSLFIFFNMNTTLLISIISTAILAGIIISIPFRSKSITKKAGQMHLPLSYKKNTAVKDIFIYIICILLFYIPNLKALQTMTSVILCACGILGAEIATRELYLHKKNGIYQNGIISSGIYLSYTDLVRIPEEQPDNNSVILQTAAKGPTTLIFADTSERDSALAKIKEIWRH